MTTPTSVPVDVFGGTGLNVAGLWQSAFRSMASPVRVQLGPGASNPARCHQQVRAIFSAVDEQCTRFDMHSDLMRANAARDAWCVVGDYCFDALRAAWDAHLDTEGWFEPRVLRTLVELGYDRTLPFATGVDVGPRVAVARVSGAAWQPRFDAANRRVQVGPEPIDLGGIGKGLALRWAGEALRRAGSEVFMIDAGGDCICAGGGPDGGGWRIGIEDPNGGLEPVAVVEVDGGACATSSVRLLTWRAGGRVVHHLIDPRTGLPGGAGLRSVTVYAPDPAFAETWSKVLFLHGTHVSSIAHERELAALWVHDDGSVGMTPSIASHLIWWRQ